MLKTFFSLSYVDLKKNSQHYKLSLLGFIVLGLIDAIPWEGMNYLENSGPEILSQVVIFLLSIIVSVDVINTQKTLLTEMPEEKLLFTAPAFLIYSLYFTICVLLGLVLFILPGVLALVFLTLAPFVAVLLNEESPMKASIRLTKKNPLLVAGMAIILLAIELFPALFNFLPRWEVKFFLELLFIFPMALLSLIFIQTMVRVTLFLEKL